MADVITILANGGLADVDTWLGVSKILDTLIEPCYVKDIPGTSRIEFFGPEGNWPGVYPASLIVKRAIMLYIFRC